MVKYSSTYNSEGMKQTKSKRIIILKIHTSVQFITILIMNIGSFYYRLEFSLLCHKHTKFSELFYIYCYTLIIISQTVL